MSRLLLNMLTGLSVGNIRHVRKNAQVKRLALQVEYIWDLDAATPQPLKPANYIISHFTHYPNRVKSKSKKRGFFRKLLDLLRDNNEKDELAAEVMNEKQENFVFLIEQLTQQSVQMSKLTRIANRQKQTIKIAAQQFPQWLARGSNNGEDDDEVFFKDSRDDLEMESDDDDDDEEYCDNQDESLQITNNQPHTGSTSYTSRQSMSHWLTVNARFQAVGRVKNGSELWTAAMKNEKKQQKFQF